LKAKFYGRPHPYEWPHCIEIKLYEFLIDFKGNTKNEKKKVKGLWPACALENYIKTTWLTYALQKFKE